MDRPSDYALADRTIRQALCSGDDVVQVEFDRNCASVAAVAFGISSFYATL